MVYVIDVVADARARAKRISGLHKEESLRIVDFLVELAEFDRLKRYEALGYARVSHWLADELHLERTQIYYRTSAARIIQRAPIALEYLRDGRVCMTRLAGLRDVITADNARDLLERATWKSREEISEIAVSIKPKEQRDPAQNVRKVPDRGATREETAPTVRGDAVGTADLTAAATETTRPLLLFPKAKVEAVAHERYALPLRFDREFKETLERAKAILSHLVPDGDPAKVIKYALDLVIAREEKRHAAPKKEVVAANENGERPYLPIDLERAVWKRDEGKCVWVYDSGRMCGSTWQLQVDHVLAIALGGKTARENLRLLCRDHNLLHERLTFGAAFVEKAIARR